MLESEGIDRVSDLALYTERELVEAGVRLVHAKKIIKAFETLRGDAHLTNSS